MFCGCFFRLECFNVVCKCWCQFVNVLNVSGDFFLASLWAMDRLWMNYCKEWIIVCFLLLPVQEVKWFMIELLPVFLGVAEDYEWAGGGNEVIKCESALFNVCLKTAGVWGRVWMSKVECVLCFQSSRRLKCVSKDSYIVWIVFPFFFFLKSSFYFYSFAISSCWLQ